MPYKDPKIAKQKAHERYLRTKDIVLARSRKNYQDNKEAITERHKKYREENKEKIAEHTKKYNAENAEKIAEQKRIYYQENKERIDARQKEYYETNKDEIHARRKKHYDENRDEILAKNRQKFAEMDEEAKNKKNLKSKEWRNSPAKYDNFAEKISPYDPIRRDPDNPELIQVQCHNATCQNWFNPTNMQLYDRLKSINGTQGGEHNLYCSESCKLTCPTYGQRTRYKGSESLYAREVQPELRAMVLARDNYTCQREGCNKSQKDFPDLVLHCHHKFPLNEDPVCSADIDNCITLCEECHRWIHKNIPGCSYAELQCSE